MDAVVRTESQGVVAITGAGGAVAPAVALSFLASGRGVALFDRPGSEGRSLAREPQLARAAQDDRLVLFEADLALEQSTRAAFERASASLGPCHGLVNVAGGFSMARADVAGLDELDRMLDVNLRSAVNASRAVLPGMLERGAGFIVAIGAGAALSPAPGKTAYAASKAAVSAYFASLAAEVGHRGVNVAVLHPMGTIDTPANRRQMPNADPATWIALEAVVDAISYLASRPAQGRVHELKLHAT